LKGNHSFTPLKALSKLNVEVLLECAGWGEKWFIAALNPPGSCLLPLFRAYGAQLTKLTCHQFLLGDHEEPDLPDSEESDKDDEKNDENEDRRSILHFNFNLVNLRDPTINNANIEDGMEEQFEFWVNRNSQISSNLHLSDK